MAAAPPTTASHPFCNWKHGAGLEKRGDGWYGLQCHCAAGYNILSKVGPSPDYGRCGASVEAEVALERPARRSWALDEWLGAAVVK
eukprot:s2013_g9.t1